MKKIFNQKNLNNFVGIPLDSRVNIHINFCLQVHFKVSAAWYCSHCLPPVSTTPHRWQICRRCRWYRWCTLTCEYLHDFLKKFEMVLLGYSGAGGETDSWKKTRSKKSRDTVPLRRSSLRQWPTRGQCAGGVHASWDPRGICCSRWNNLRYPGKSSLKALDGKAQLWAGKPLHYTIHSPMGILKYWTPKQKFKKSYLGNKANTVLKLFVCILEIQ